MSKIKCDLCNDIIESKYRHDFVTCKCGACSVDGGNEYLRILGDLSKIQLLDKKTKQWVHLLERIQI